jgi:hypothetical protein
MANELFNVGKRGILDGTINLTSDTLKIALLTATYTFNPDTTFIDTGGASDIVDARVPGTTDITLSNKAFATDNSLDRSTFDNTVDPAFSAGNTTVDATQFVIYKDTGDPATSPPIYQGTITATPTNGIAITVQFNASGIFALA